MEGDVISCHLHIKFTDTSQCKILIAKISVNDYINNISPFNLDISAIKVS